jgi:hypothetical protein
MEPRGFEPVATQRRGATAEVDVEEEMEAARRLIVLTPPERKVDAAPRGMELTQMRTRRAVGATPPLIRITALLMVGTTVPPPLA